MLSAHLRQASFRAALLAATGAVALAAPAAGGPPAAPTLRLDFESTATGTAPEGWNASEVEAWGWTLAADETKAHSGKRSLHLAVTEPHGGSGFTWTTDATPFRGRVVRVELTYRNHGDAPPILVEVERPGHAVPFRGAIAMPPAPAEGGTEEAWRTVSLEGGVAPDATTVTVRILPPGRGWEGWIDDLAIVPIASLEERPYEIRRIAADRLADRDIHPFALRSERLSAFAGHDVTMRAAVFVPPGSEPATLPVAYFVHGFGGDHTAAWILGPRFRAALAEGNDVPLLHVFLDGSCPLGHHEFADSANNGPWGEALVHELIPAIEKAYGGIRPASRRFVTGHSSGGWSALWLMVRYPDTFGGCWATAPDPVDFRDFSGIDLYTATNLYRDEHGEPRPLVMRDGKAAMTVEAYARNEWKVAPLGGQLASFEAVFSPRGPDGVPLQLFDRETGAIDRSVVEAWKAYDIGLLLRQNAAELVPKLKGKVHVWCGSIDTFRLDGAVRLLQADLAKLGSDADVLLVEGRDHGSLWNPHDELWPKGMSERIHREMAKAAAARNR